MCHKTHAKFLILITIFLVAFIKKHFENAAIKSYLKEGFFPQKDNLRALFLTLGSCFFDVTENDVKSLLTLEWLHLG